jgi:hypothetical protein
MFKKFFFISFAFYVVLIVAGSIHFSKDFNRSKDTIDNKVESKTQDSLNKNVTLDDIQSQLTAKEQTTNFQEGDLEFYKNYGDPYCIITTVNFKFPSLIATLYSTHGFEPCIDKDFKLLTIPSVKAQMQTLTTAFFYSLNPPQLSTMTSNLSQPSEPFINIGKFRFSKFANAKIPLPSLLSDPQATLNDGAFFQPGNLPYKPFETQQDLYAYWKQGSLVFGLASPTGKYYVMTSFAYSSLKNLEITNLKDLNKYLSLKPGWKFVSFKLKKPLILRYQVEDGFATRRVVDEFGNYYIEIQSLSD